LIINAMSYPLRLSIPIAAHLLVTAAYQRYNANLGINKE